MFGYFLALILGLAGGAGSTLILFGHEYHSARQKRREAEEQAQLNSALSRQLRSREDHLDGREAQISKNERAFNARVVSYQELDKENLILKRDLRNLHLSTRKHSLDRASDGASQAQLADHCQQLAKRLLRDNLKWIDSKLNSGNFPLCQQRLAEVITWCRQLECPVPPDEEQTLFEELRAEYRKVVRAEQEREEQARIKAQMREEARLEREAAREIEQAEGERRRIQAALDLALRSTLNQHASEIEALRAELAAAEARSQRAVSMAQITKAGHVYVISNLGSFGAGVFKVGMTRRLEPHDRVKELGSASVPFPFDVHMMISCLDAPKLENSLHKALHHHRVNRCNLRKEFFRTDIETIRTIVEKNHGVVEYIADVAALEFHQSMTISDSDLDSIQQVYDDISNIGEDFEEEYVEELLEGD